MKDRLHNEMQIHEKHLVETTELTAENVELQAEVRKLEETHAAQIAMMEAAHFSELGRKLVKAESLQSFEAKNALKASEKVKELQDQLAKAWHQADEAMADRRQTGRELEEARTEAAAQARRADIASGEALQRLA